MKQAIITRYLPATETKGSRIKAEATSGSITVPYDYDFDPNGNHTAAAAALALKLGQQYPHGDGWRGYWIGGGAAGERGNVYVHVGAELPAGLIHRCEGTDYFNCQIEG